MAKTKNQIAFPFFGAGDADYFERIYLHILLGSVPTAANKKLIEDSAPEFLNPHWKDCILVMSSDQFVHESIAKKYKAKPKDKSGGKEGDLFFAKKSQVSAFNQDLEKWLIYIHAVSPVLAVYRRVDLESNGTDFSDWHIQSFGQAEPVLKKLKADKGNKLAKEMLEGIKGMQSEFEAAANTPTDLDPILQNALDKGDSSPISEQLNKNEKFTLDKLCLTHYFPMEDEKAPDMHLYQYRRKALVGVWNEISKLEFIPQGISAAVFIEALYSKNGDLLKALFKLADDERPYVAADIQNIATDFVRNPHASTSLRDELITLAPKNKAVTEGLYYGLSFYCEDDCPNPSTGIPMMTQMTQSKNSFIDGRFFQNFLWTIVLSLEKQQKVDPALMQDVIKTSLPYAVKKPEIYLNITCIYLAQKKEAEALDYLKKAASSNLEPYILNREKRVKKLLKGIS